MATAVATKMSKVLYAMKNMTTGRISNRNFIRG
jgi:hypothetical protein